METFKRFLRNRRVLIPAILAVLAIPTAWLLAKDTVVVEDSSLIATVRKGEFKVIVTTSGELRAPRFVQITIPPNTQQAQVY